MIDILAANAEKTEQRRRPTAESVQAAREAGAFALGTPVEYGGRGAGATEVARMLTTMGRACPSTAWIAATSLTGKVLAARSGDFGDRARATMFADPDALFCGTGRPGGHGERGAEHVRISGRWSSVSGCEDAEWAALATMVDGTFSMAVIPMADLTVDRDWDVAGMRGTGSHTVVAEGVLVDADFVTPLKAPPTAASRRLFGVAHLAPVVGATFAALDLTVAMFASSRKPFMTSYASMGESPGARHWLAEAATLSERAERTMLTVAAEVDESAALNDRDAGRMALNLADAARDCRQAVDLMLDLHGTGAFATRNPLQRLWRDVAVGSRHFHLNRYLAVEGYGALLAG
ncbi:acyl-CoA dehydrogenase family protein [Catenuloplanes japonicus]|uniref:acyl-CoA dehydrogenase family protein n=1 Tax=Catenuloplanes japonicus TaxID=33876 RepID=UPI0005268C6B|nr:acyl-CoA dehydrogenase family protein [Catenuloplanes japonicus]